ncbi:disease resistance protein RPV1-like isoform X2 [Trifolium pratense]|nr:disease resistance protein RPV1-like isoform X2 [Trifolium pratense]
MSASCSSFQPSSDPNLLDLGSCSIRSNRYRYDVFISFRGSDTRNGFVGHLYGHLVRKGLIVFKDDIELRRGEYIAPQLLQAIKDSRVSIVVFSKDYASSTWCLDEMTAIDECRAELRQTVFPIFYDVDPSHVRKQNGVYENAFVVHTESFKHEPHRVDGWKKAMTYLAGLGGTDVRNKPEFDMIETIVQDVTNTLNPKLSGCYDHLIGVRPRVEALERLLNLKSEDNAFRVLGIRGMDGIGKTTLANVLYDTIAYQFSACCFIENLSTIYRDGDAIAVKKQILHQTLKEKNLDAYNLSEISKILKNRLYNMKVLIVLDDVDQFEQLDELHIDPKLLHPGSRIIITTRDVHILELYGANIIHEVELMNDYDARELLCRKAFKNGNSSNDYAELISNVLRYAQGLPLAIKVMGSFLYNKNTTQWKDTLKGLEKNPNSEILKVLRSSFKRLERREKEIFLHIACFFDGEREDYVRRVLDAFGLQHDIGISLIAKKSFITIQNKKIYMHKMFQELGKKIIREQHPNEPRLWSRLWLYCDLHDAIIKSEAICAKAIILNQKEDVSKFKQLRDEDLAKMKNLKVLILNHTKFSGSSKFLSNSLRYLLWNGCPMAYLPSNFQPYNLVELNMPNGSIVQLWEDIQELPFLKRMDISNSKNLKVTPRFEGMQYLERLDLTGCINLSEVHPSIGLLEKLEFLSLQNCTSLVNLDFGNAARLWSLKVLRLSDCKKLENTPNFSGLIFLQYLDMGRCASISTIHESIGTLENLRFISLRDCTDLVEIPAQLLRSLTTLDLCGCSKFNKLSLRHISTSQSLQSLIFLDLSFCNIVKVPDAIGEFRCLERLNLQGNNFTELPSTFGGLDNLSYLNLSHCHKLQSLSYLLPARSSSVGRYFKTTPGTRNHRSGLYIFDSPNYKKHVSFYDYEYYFGWLFTRWVKRLVMKPLHFRCGFDIVLPLHGDHTTDCDVNLAIPRYFRHRYNGSSIARMTVPVLDVDWLGFLFYVTFDLNNHNQQSSSSQLPHPFYLSFESEFKEERFDMALNLELNKVDGEHYIWMIYISQEHCHFVKTGAHITFKARQGLIIKEWGLRLITKKDTQGSMMEMSVPVHLPLENVKVKQRSDSSSFEPKIQLPYNWFVSDKDEANGKETDLFNLGLSTEIPQ